MKKKSGFTLFFMLLLFANPIISFGQIPDQIISGLKAGDAKIVASHFNENVDLVVLDRELVCSQAQGEQILKDFFAGINHRISRLLIREPKIRLMRLARCRQEVEISGSISL
jgi:hypothetical protein